MLWLDSTYPVDSTKVGSKRGSCATTSGDPVEVESKHGDSSVVFSNIKFGPVGSTFSSTPGTNPGTGTSSSSSTSTAPKPTSTGNGNGGGNTGTVGKYGQCGGYNWTGPTKCVEGSTCNKQNEYYSQCL